MPEPKPEDTSRARAGAAAAVLATLRLPPRLTLSEWADQNRILSAESSAEPGPWKTDRVPFLREIMDTISGREYQEVAIMKSSQTAGTEALNNAVGYYIDQEPSPILVIQPNVKPMAEAWSKDRLAPMLRDTPCLRGKVKDPRARDSGNTVLHKTFPGGYITVIGANSPAGLASRPIRIILADEIDRWPASAGSEGDPLSLARARTITYRHRKKHVMVSTPGNKGESRMEKLWETSDQRQFHVPCPHCGFFQPLVWRDKDRNYRLVWESVGEGELKTYLPDTAQYVCIECAALIDETHKPAMLGAGKWVKHNPTSKIAGFHITGLMSPWMRWREVAKAWLDAKDDPEQRKTFFNTVLGLLYEESGERIDAEGLSARREEYKAEVPGVVGVLTAAVDVQGDRIEVEVRGWAEGEESYQVRLERLYGDPEQADVWERLQTILDRPWKHESGAQLRIQATMIDSGFLTDTVYRYVRPRQIRGVFALKGVDNAKDPISRASRANRDGVKVFTVNPSKLKDVLFARLRRKKPGAGYLHFGKEAQTGADEGYYLQFGAEKRIVEFKNNRPIVKYIQLPGRRNEAIDLYCYNLAALRSLGMTVSRRLKAIAAQLAAKEAAKVSTSEQDEPAEDVSDLPVRQSRKKFRRQSRWVDAWKN